MARPTADNIFGYIPSLAAALVFSILYFCWTVWHFYLCFWYSRRQTHKHRYTIPLFVAALLTCAGYALRVASTKATYSISPYAVSSSFVVVSPIFVCASLYLLLTYLVSLCLPPGPDQLLFHLPPQWLGRVFITSDVFSFLTQASGGGIASSANWQGNTRDIGVDILLAGLTLQLATFTSFLIFTWRFVCRVQSIADAGFNPCVKKVLTGIWVASVFIQIRTVYRIVEFALGVNSYPFLHEWCLYVFEAIPMFIAIGVLAWCHPITWLQQKSRHELGPEKQQRHRNAPHTNKRDTVAV